MSNDLTKEITLEGVDQQVTLAELASIDMTDVQEKRGLGPFPKGTFRFKVKEAKLDTVEQKDEKTDRLVNIPVVRFEMGVSEIIGLGNPEFNVPEKHAEIMKRTYKCVIFIKNFDDIGRIKAFLTDSGFKGAGKLNELLDGFKGHEFIAPIKHKPNKNDPDFPYVNIVWEKVSPIPTVPSA